MSERAAPIAERGPPLPAGARAYRTIGPFGADAIPAGLLRRHDLKDGAWGLLSVSAGAIRFHWDDDKGGSRLLKSGDTMLIPPGVPHHLERQGSVTITIAFCAA
jgi:tellurite resistance-related uncharacterized protein